MSATEKRVWRWAFKVLVVFSAIGYLAGQAHLARKQAAARWEERYEEREWYERRAPNWFERAVYGVEP